MQIIISLNYCLKKNSSYGYYHHKEKKGGGHSFFLKAVKSVKSKNCFSCLAKMRIAVLYLHIILLFVLTSKSICLLWEIWLWINLNKFWILSQNKKGSMGILKPKKLRNSARITFLAFQYQQLRTKNLLWVNVRMKYFVFHIIDFIFFILEQLSLQQKNNYILLILEWNPAIIQQRRDYQG